jgi:hypothetical protein
MASGKRRFRDVFWSYILLQPEGFFEWVTGTRATLPPNRQAGNQLPPPRKVSHYKIWRARLLRLEKEYKEADPRNLRTWFHDRRRRKDWFTFWLAVVALILAIALGGAGIGAAGYTAWAAGKTLKLAEAAPAQGTGSSSPVTIVVCCNPTANGTFSTAAYYTPTTSGPPSIVSVLVTATAYATVTTTELTTILETTLATQI